MPSSLANFIYIYILLCFRFGGICEEHARLLHRYIHGNVVCCLPPHHLYLAFLPMLSLQNVLKVFYKERCLYTKGNDNKDTKNIKIKNEHMDTGRGASHTEVCG